MKINAKLQETSGFGNKTEIDVTFAGSSKEVIEVGNWSIDATDKLIQEIEKLIRFFGNLDETEEKEDEG